MQYIEPITSGVDEDFKNFKPLQSLKEMINVKPSLVVLPLIIVTLLLTIIFPNASFYIMTIVLIIYPSFMSFEAIHQKDYQKCKKWLTFWLIFGFFTVFNGLLKTLLFFVPSFYSFRFLFLLWLFYPRTDGITLLYQKIVKPYAQNIKIAAQKLIQGK